MRNVSRWRSMVPIQLMNGKKKKTYFLFVFLLHVFFYFKCLLPIKKKGKKVFLQFLCDPPPFLFNPNFKKERNTSSCTEKLIRIHTHTSAFQVYIEIYLKNQHVNWLDLGDSFHSEEYSHLHVLVESIIGVTAERLIINILPRVHDSSAF